MRLQRRRKSTLDPRADLLRAGDHAIDATRLMTTLGPGALAFPFKEVLWPLGMPRTVPETDWQGHYVMSSQVWMTADRRRVSTSAVALRRMAAKVLECP